MADQAIEVRIWGKTVGAVALNEADGYYAFGYAKGWLKGGVELAPRTMPVAGYTEPYIFRNLSVETFRKLPGMLSDALPDDFGNAVVNAYLITHGRPLESITPLDRLAYMGRRGIGALEFRPAKGSRTESEDAIDMQDLVEKARMVVQGDLSTEPKAVRALHEIINVGASAGGARPKAVIAWNPTTNEIRSGQFDVAPGFEHWLLKFDGMGKSAVLGDSKHFGKLEYAFYLMARNAGIQMSQSRLLHENGRAHFMTKRFDRDGNRKHHLQSLCAMEHMDFKHLATHAYGQAFMTIDAIGIGQAAKDELFRRMAFNVIARNCDDHSKNLAFLLQEGGAWELSPAYDLTPAYNPKGKWTFQHQMSVNGKFKDITKEDLLLDAERYSVRSPARILEVITDAVGSFDQFAKEAGVSAANIREARGGFVKL